MSKSKKCFVVVAKAAVEIRVEARTCVDAMRQYQQRLARCPRLRGKGLVVQLLADAPAVLDLETGRGRRPRTAQATWNAPSGKQIAAAAARDGVE